MVCSLAFPLVCLLTSDLCPLIPVAAGVRRLKHLSFEASISAFYFRYFCF